MGRFQGRRERRGQQKKGSFGIAEKPVNEGLGSTIGEGNIIITAKLLSSHCGTGIA